MVRDGTRCKTVLYHAGHYGFVSKYLIHKMSRHDNDRAIILVDCTFASPETREFLSGWKEDNGSGCEIITYADGTFWKYKAVEEVRQAIIEFFDNMMCKLDLNIKSVDYIYSGYDGLNAFAAYLCTQGVKYVAFDVLGNTTNFRLAESFYDNKRVRYTNTAQAYLDLMKEYDVLTARSEYVSSILFTDVSRTTNVRDYEYFDYISDIKSLSTTNKERLRKIYQLDKISLSKGVVVPLRSYATVKYSGVEYDSNITPFQKFLWIYRVVVDCFHDSEDTIILKAHPNYALPADVVNTFPNSIYVGGHVPFDLMEVTGLKNLKFLSIGGTSPSFSTVKEIICLPENFFSASLQLFAMLSSYIISKATFGNECRIDFKDDEDRKRWSSFFTSLSKKCMKISNAPNIIIADSKRTSSEELEYMVNMLDYDSVIILHNPEINKLSNKSFITYFQIVKKEHEGYRQDIMGTISDEFIAVLYLNPKIQSVLEGLHYRKSMSRCSLDFVIEPLVSWQPTSGADFVDSFDVIHKCAIAGHVESIGYLARVFRDGKGVKQDLDKAAEWMRKAADKNIGWAKNELFDILWRINTPESKEEMISVATAFAETGDGNAMGRLGRAYRDGKGVEKDLDKAAEYFKKVADLHLNWVAEATDVMLKTNSPDNWNYAFKRCSEVANLPINVDGLIRAGAMGRLGYMYRDGKGVEKDLDKAVEWMYKAFKKHPKWEREFNEMLLKCNTFWKNE